MQIKLQIKSILGSLIFECEKEDNTIAETLKEAIKSGANLSGADLSGADLRSADLRSANLRSAYLSGANLRSANLRSANLSGANLSGADLSGADLRSADLRSANLSGADLSGADLRSANLSGANLSGANLSGADLRSAYLRSANLRSANLSGADLSGADLRSANLRSANLRSANLMPIKSDFFEILIHAIPEVSGLKKKLIEGKINGSVYEGECCCLVGTLANERMCRYNTMNGIVPDGGRPAERFFAGIMPGDTPDNNGPAKIVLQWIEEFESLVTPIPVSK
ncbi:uncharacterized protein YjbI with pentapeptide repeats [Chitinophaga polysaccharea]|uniref:Uncharacterized protein YjbI with pentapeptide repeats n=1 Tax=Chitinophaga polysaccharea TaxID=1293035 RepID=A0A561PL67_9BACT|nr:pentapeptide repeat-containing protein [Chitinophaga polysaccharea]TWF38830.1 uncharacterized protein YjbI with pentapeptide repeats [Chitinophaga polysaccharea]